MNKMYVFTHTAFVQDFDATRELWRRQGLGKVLYLLPDPYPLITFPLSGEYHTQLQQGTADFLIRLEYLLPRAAKGEQFVVVDSSKKVRSLLKAEEA